jgi:GrpB-like predicted nucleotidyltransferase (UPF0157 family)
MPPVLPYRIWYAAVFKNDLVTTHHIGSTFVPGMLAKPVIDIMVLVSDIHILDNHKAELESMGYHWMGEYRAPVQLPRKSSHTKLWHLLNLL